MFLLYINDIVHDIGSNIRLFADGTSLFIILDDPVKAAGCINTYLVRISKWASTWLVTFNPSKTETLLISRKLNRPVHPPLYMEDHQISEVDSHKHLGLYFSHDCTWHQHINHITIKAWARINIMRKLKLKLDRKPLETIYTAFIRPPIEYGDIIWDNCSQYQKDELDKIQNEAARITTGATRLISLQTIDASTTLYYNSFLPSTVRAWNEVPEEAKQSDSVNAFKRFLNQDKSRIPKHFYVGKRKAQILHTRLRTNCSSLNLDLFMRNISDSPLCQSGSVENAQHFFFHCRNYHVPRTQLLNTVSQYQTPSLSLLLYGNDSFSLETNTVIFETVQKFILDSKRF